MSISKRLPFTKESIEDKIPYMVEEDHKEIILRLPAGRSAGTQSKGCEELVKLQYELLA